MAEVGPHEASPLFPSQFYCGRNEPHLPSGTTVLLSPSSSEYSVSWLVPEHALVLQMLNVFGISKSFFF